MESLGNVKSRPWMESSSQSRPRSKGKRARAIVYPSIYQSAQELEDPYWKDLISDLACGVLPSKKFSFESKQILVYRKKTTPERFAIPENPEEAVEGLIEFLKETGVRSSLDKEQARSRHSRPEPPPLRTKWDEVPKRDQIRLREWYVEKMINEHNLSSEEADDLRTELALGFMFDCFRNADIKMANSVIVNILTLTFDLERRKWYRPQTSSHAKSRKTTRNPETVSGAPQIYLAIGQSFERFFAASQMGTYRASFRTQTIQT